MNNQEQDQMNANSAANGSGDGANNSALNNASRAINYDKDDFDSGVHSAIIQAPFPFDPIFSKFLEVAGLEGNLSSAVIFGIYGTVEASAKDGKWVEISGYDMLEGQEPTETFDNYLSPSTARRYAIDLCCVYAKGKCTPANIKNYFLSHNVKGISNNIVEAICRYAVSKYSHIISDDTISEAIKTSTWLRYRLTYSSTARICHDAIEAMGRQLAVKVLGEEQVEAVRDALSSPWSKEKNELIGSRTAGLVYIYMLACQRDMGEWYQGTRAVESLPIFVRLAARSYFDSLIKSMPVVDHGTDDETLHKAGVFF